MPGIADLLYLGQPDPSRQLAAMLSGQQPPGAPPPGPGAAGAAGAAGPGSAGPGAAGPPPPVAPGAPPPPGSPPVPQALQSTPDMSSSYAQLASPPNIMSLYMQMQQRQSASDQINRGLALIAANHSAPSMRESIMQSLTGGQGDAGQMVGNLMSLHSAMQQQGATQDMLTHASDYDAKLNLPPGTARDMILSGKGPDLVSRMEPTDMAKNYTWARNTYAANHPGASADEIEEGAQGILMGMSGGGGDAATRSWRAAKIQWDANPSTKGTPYPWGVGADDSPISFASWQTTQKTQETAQAQDQTEAARLRPGYVQNLTGLRNKITDITGPLDANGNPTDPNKAALLQSVMQSPFAQAYLKGDPSSMSDAAMAWVRGLSQDQQTLLNSLKDATDPNQMLGTLNKRAPKRGVADVNDIGTGLAGLTNIRKPYEDWLAGANNTIKAIDTATGNAFGASGEAENAPENVKKYIDPTYLYGGAMYPKGKQPLPPSQPQLDEAQQRLTAAKNAGQDPEAVRSNLIQYYLTHNLNPAPLKKMEP